MKHMNKQLITHILESLAVGDAYGKSTEFASRLQIQDAFDSVDTLLTPSESLKHTDMRHAQVTDDTEINFFLLEDYCSANEVTAEIAAKSLLRWYRETPEPLKYIGPSSLAAIKAIEANEPLEETGKKGTSCGGIMRAPAPFLLSSSLEELREYIIATLTPSHNTPLALEAAMGYGYALHKMGETKDMGQIIAAAIEGSKYGRTHHTEGLDDICAPSCAHRIQYLAKEIERFDDSNALLDFLFYIYGTTISSCDVFVASFALFLWAKDDVFLAIKLATMLGGDTDTIACLAAILCCAYAGEHNLPRDIVSEVKAANKLDFDGLTQCIINYKRNRP